MSRSLDAILSQPWAIEPGWLDIISAIAQREGEIEQALQLREHRTELLDSMPGERMDGTARVRIRDGVAIVPAIGPIIRYGNMFSKVSGAQSLQSLAQDFRVAVESPDVGAIVLYADGPGGQASGINEFANQVFEARNKKRVVGYVAGMAASAHYWFTSALSEIVIDATAELGSIGVVFGYTDRTEADKKSGRQRVEVVSARAPLKRAKPTEDAGLREIQARANAMEDVFLRAVARNRGVDVGTVETDFGRGGILVGQAAVDAGLADRLGNFESLISELAGSASKAKRSYFAMPKSQTEGVPAAEDKPVTAESIKADYPQVAASLIQEGVDAQAEKKIKEGDVLKAEAAEAERTRITAILDLAGASLSEEASKAISGGDSPESYAMAALKEARALGVSLSDIAADSTEVPHAPKPGNQSAASVWDAVANKKQETL